MRGTLSMIRTMGPAALLATGCGAGVPLLHGAHPLNDGELSFGAGMSAQLVKGSVARSILRGEQDRDQVDREDRVIGAMLRSSTAPGLAPWIGARAGLGYESEAGLAYTGRELRLDARKAWTRSAWAVSAGAGVAALLSRQPNEAADASTQTGFGIDVPLLIGWRSDPDVVKLWTGVRGGLERLRGSYPLAPDGGASASSVDANASRWYAGPLVGLAVGVEPVWVAFELAGGYQSIHGTLHGTARGALDLDSTGFTKAGFALAPAAGLVGRF